MRSRRWLAIIGSTVLAACHPAPRIAAASFPVRSALRVDTIGLTVTLPLQRGAVGARLVWYVVTESSDRRDAERRGVTWAPRLARLAGTAAAQSATLDGDRLRYTAGISFPSPAFITPAPDSGFPVIDARPGSLADEGYSPFVRLPSGVVLNAPIIADEYHAIARVAEIDPIRGIARLKLARGYGDGRTVWYFSTDASDPIVAALEGSTYTPALDATPGLGDGAAATSARTGLVAVINGAHGRDDPDRQGLQSAVLDGLAPLNILEHLPDPSRRDTRYSPAWDLHPVQWTAAAIQQHAREKLFGFSDVATAMRAGLVVAAGRGPANATTPGLRAAGVVINCPVMLVVRR